MAEIKSNRNYDREAKMRAVLKLHGWNMMNRGGGRANEFWVMSNRPFSIEELEACYDKDGNQRYGTKQRKRAA